MHQVNRNYYSLLKVKLNEENNSLYPPPWTQNHLYSEIND